MFMDAVCDFASTMHLSQSNRNTSGSNILAGSQFDGSSSRRSSQGHESSYQHEIELSDVVAPTQETNRDEANSNATQQVVS